MATLELRNVNKSYGSGLADTLKNIELAIDSGEFLILVGPLLPVETRALQTGLIGLVAFTTTFSGVQYVAAWGRRYLRRRDPASVD